MSLFKVFMGSFCRRGNDLTEFVCTKFQVGCYGVGLFRSAQVKTRDNFNPCFNTIRAGRERGTAA